MSDKTSSDDNKVDNETEKEQEASERLENKSDAEKESHYVIHRKKTYNTKEREQNQLEKKIQHLVTSGHLFQAHDLARHFFETNQDNVSAIQLYSLVLLKTGAAQEARALIYPLLGISENDEIKIEDIQRCNFLKTSHPHMIANIGHIFKEAWQYSHACDDLAIAREMYISAFKRDLQTTAGMNAAWMCWLTGEDHMARDIVEQVLKNLPSHGLSRNYNELSMLAEAQLLLGREEDAQRLYSEAMDNPPENYLDIVATRQQLLFLQEAGFKVDKSLLQILTPPTIVVFTGHAIDHPALQSPLFPPENEMSVYNSIKNTLREIDVKIGYSSAACGSDIMFIEALHEMGGEINIVLPFAIADFVEMNVRYAGPRWEKRFEHALAIAHTVNLATEDRYLGHDMLYRFSNHVTHGSAVMRGHFLTTEPHLMAVWHSRTESVPGGPNDFIDRWTNISTLHLIDVDEYTPEHLKEHIPVATPVLPSALPINTLTQNAPDRTIKAMMFSDLSGYSNLQDEHIPAFLDFLQKLETAIGKIKGDISSLNTWGDAVFAVADNAITVAEFGLRYCDVVETLGKQYTEFPFPIRARISLHIGPVFVAEDPFLKKNNFYGGHINRAARLEPVTRPGQVYATQQFISILSSEINGKMHEYEQQGLRYYDYFKYEYVGVISLAKNFGNQEVYHLRWK